jgi:hypothetical protein
VIELIRQYLEILQKTSKDANAQAELERIYMEALHMDPNHRLVKLHQLMIDGVSMNITEQVRDLLAEEIASLKRIPKDDIE